MSLSHEASHGACLESAGLRGQWGSVLCGIVQTERGVGHCAFRQVGVGSGVNW